MNFIQISLINFQSCVKCTVQADLQKTSKSTPNFVIYRTMTVAELNSPPRRSVMSSQCKKYAFATMQQTRVNTAEEILSAFSSMKQTDSDQKKNWIEFLNHPPPNYFFLFQVTCISDLAAGARTSSRAEAKRPCFRNYTTNMAY